MKLSNFKIALVVSLFNIAVSFLLSLDNVMNMASNPDFQKHPAIFAIGALFGIGFVTLFYLFPMWGILSLWSRVVEEDPEELTVEKLNGETKEVGKKSDNLKISILISFLYGLIFSMLSIIGAFQTPNFKNHPLLSASVISLMCIVYATVFFGLPIWGMLNWKSKKQHIKKDSLEAESDEREYDVDKAA